MRFVALTKDIKNGERCSLFLFVCLLILAGCQPQKPANVQVVLSGPIMGTQYRITAIVSPELDVEALEESVLAAMQAVNQSMSTYIEGSELSQLNRALAGEVTPLSISLAEVLTQAQSISVLSDGAFDVTLAPAINLWGFGPNGRITQKPSEQTLNDLRASVGYQNIELQEQGLRKKSDSVSIDLSAIAKGYGVDQAANVLQRSGVTDYLVNIGGELKASGRNIDQQVWRVGIEKPHILGGIQKVVALVNSAIATSGDYRNYYIIDGQHYSHTIDAKTLSPVFHKLALVSVIHESASMADGLATALMAMGEQQALRFANEHDLSAYFIIRGNSEDEFVEQMTDSFRLNLQ